MKNVYVSIAGKCTVGGEEDKTEMVTEGEYTKRGDKYLLRYTEHLSEDDEGSVTFIKFGGESVVMSRNGSVNTQMIFENGKRNISHYETPLGSFTVGVTTKMMDVHVDESGGDAKIQYMLDINNAEQIENYLHINIRG